MNEQHMEKLQKELLDLLRQYPDGACRNHMPCADRANDKVRQSLRRKGQIVYEDRGMGARWFLVQDKP